MRPLDKNGRAQAESLVGQLLAFGATEFYAADRLRCRQTIEPLAQELGAEIRAEEAVSAEGYAADRDGARARVLDLVGSVHDRGGTPVICSQGEVIPDLVGWWCKRDAITPDKSRNRKGSTWVLSLSDGHLVAADHIDTALSAVG